MFKKLTKNFPLVFIALLLTILFTWPFILKLGTLYSDNGDYPLIGWILKYNYNSILSGRVLNQQEYFDANQFYPLPYTLAYSEHLFVPSLLFSIIYFLTHNLIFSVNYLVFLTLILSFISSYYVTYFFISSTLTDVYEKKKILASILGATVYTFNPLTFSHFPSHFHLMNKYFLPLVILFLYKFLHKPNLKNSFLYFLFFTLNALSSIYFMIFSIVLVPVFSLPYIINELLKRNLAYFLKLGKYSLILAVFLPILLYFNLPYLEFSLNEGFRRHLEENAHYSARLMDWFSPNPYNLIYGNFAKNLEKIRLPKEPLGDFNYAEHTLYLNILPTILFIIGLSFFLRNFKYRKEDKSLYYGLLFTLISAFISTFGPFYQGWNSTNGSFKLALYYFDKVIPILSVIRVPSRFQFLFYIPFSFLVAYGALWVLQKTQKHTYLVFLCLLIVLFIENANTYDFNSKSKIIDQINNLPNRYTTMLNNSNTVHFPVFINDLTEESRYLAWATFTNEDMLNGYSGYFPQDWLSLMNSISNNLDQDSLLKLKVLGLNYLIVHKNLLTNEQQAIFESNDHLYNAGKIFEDKQLEIINLNKFSFKFSYCNPKTDFSYKFMPTKTATSLFNIIFNNPHYLILLKNNNGCFLVSQYLNRYASVDYLTDKGIDNFKIKLPILINPYEQLILKQ